MKFSDILGMSLINLWRRKTRTVLTVLGVVIGTASIVVMLSLGLGLKQATMAQVSTAGGLTEIMVSSEGEYGIDDLLLSDSTVNQFLELEHVENVDPQIWYSLPIQTGIYEAYVSVIGTTKSYLKNIELEQGEIPDNEGSLSIIVGNQVIQDFFEYKTGTYPYWESEELPDIDLMRASILGGIEVEENYTTDTGTTTTDTGYSDPTFSDDGGEDFSVNNEFDGTDSDSDEGTGASQSDSPDYQTVGSDDFNIGNDFSYDDYSEQDISYSSFTSSTKRTPIKVMGITAGGMDTNTEYSLNCYTDLDTLRNFLKKNYSLNDIIPGQPTDKSGKPYKELKYSQLVVKVDESSNVEEVLQTIQDMGYRADANKEWLEETEKEFMIIEAVLGGIGAISLLVSAIGIANTMTMSTYERTKEIGVMKVLGCGLANIRSMFLAEAAFIGFLGGAVGLLLSFMLSLVANKFVAPMFMEGYGLSSKISVIPIWLVLMSLVFSTIIGMVAGFFPAQRATKLSPLAAIRND